MKASLNLSQNSLKQASDDLLRLEESCSTLMKIKDTLQANLNEANEKITQLEDKVESLQKEVSDRAA